MPVDNYASDRSLHTSAQYRVTEAILVRFVRLLDDCADVEYIIILIHSTTKLNEFSVDTQINLIYQPPIRSFAFTSFERTKALRTKVQAPVAA